MFKEENVFFVVFNEKTHYKRKKEVIKFHLEQKCPEIIHYKK